MYHRHQGLDAMYAFTHQSGRQYIAQSWAEFTVLQMRQPDRKVPDMVNKFIHPKWSGPTYHRHGYAEFPRFPSREQREAEDRINKVWDACKGFEKLFQTPGFSRLSTGYYSSGIHKFLACIGNHAIMMGDAVLYHKSQAMMPTGNILCLPPAK